MLFCILAPQPFLCSSCGPGSFPVVFKKRIRGLVGVFNAPVHATPTLTTPITMTFVYTDIHPNSIYLRQVFESVGAFFLQECLVEAR